MKHKKRQMLLLKKMDKMLSSIKGVAIQANRPVKSTEGNQPWSSVTMSANVGCKTLITVPDAV